MKNKEKAKETDKGKKSGGKGLKLGWKHLATAESLNAKIWTTNCLQQAEIPYRIKKKNIGAFSNPYDIGNAHHSTIEVKAKDYDKAVEALRNLPERARAALLKSDADFEAMLKTE